ncbi:MAG: hypothetical protein ACFB4I_23250 [Cyanophyceae cyanobacterium]
MMQATSDLTSAQWQIAHVIALKLVKEETDVNELGKTIAYLRSAIDRDLSNAKTQFFNFLSVLVKNGNQIGHSDKTPEYYRNIEKACKTHLRNEEFDVFDVLQILGWAARLMRYYKVAPKSIQTFKVEQIIEAQVYRKHSKGHRVTYSVAGIPFTEKESKKFDKIPESGTVKVQIRSLKEDGSIKHIKFVES